MLQTKVRKRAVAKPKQPETVAMHASDAEGKLHGVGIWDLRVFIVPDGKFWFAQGLEIDLAAQGDSVEDAKKNFEDGLASSIDLHLRMYGNIEKLLNLAPAEIWQEARRDRKRINVYSQVSLHNLAKSSEMARWFDNITYLLSGAAA